MTTPTPAGGAPAFAAFADIARALDNSPSYKGGPGSGPPLGDQNARKNKIRLHDQQNDFVDVMVLLIPGALLAAAVRQLLSPAMVEQFSKDHPVMAISAMSGLAFVITLCSETDAFVARTFAVRPAAQLAFLVFGPMLDLKLFFMYTRVFLGRRQLNARARRAVILLEIGPAGKPPIFVLQAAAKRDFPVAAP